MGVMDALLAVSGTSSTGTQNQNPISTYTPNGAAKKQQDHNCLLAPAVLGAGVLVALVLAEKRR